MRIDGKVLDVSHLVNKKRRFRGRGGINGAMEAMENLQKEGLGKLKIKTVKGTAKVRYC